MTKKEWYFFSLVSIAYDFNAAQRQSVRKDVLIKLLIFLHFNNRVL
jgi:hypothetical protein